MRRERVGREGKGLKEGGTALEVYKEEKSVQTCHSLLARCLFCNQLILDFLVTCQYFTFCGFTFVNTRPVFSQASHFTYSTAPLKPFELILLGSENKLKNGRRK